MAPLSFHLLTFAATAYAAVQVTKTGRGPTGYEVTITYENASVQDVQLGSLPHLTDQYRTSFTYSAQFDLSQYRPGDFPADPFEPLAYQMNATGDGRFSFTAPFPSGTFQYNFLLDCQNVTLCTPESGQQVTDPENPPFETVNGTEFGSPFQVPFDAEFQYDTTFGLLDFDYALPIEDEDSRGVVRTDFYPSPGAVSPSPGIHDFAVYLPAGYSNTSDAPYPLLYLSHGGGGAAGDWENQAYVSNILDRLIHEGYIESTVVVMPTFNGLLNTSNPPAHIVRPLYQQYLFPYVEENYRVSTDPARRAFAGLSLGSVLTYEMYINATSYFGYYGMFSGALLPGKTLSDYVNGTMAANNPDLLGRGITVAYGQYDIAFDDSKLLQAALDGIGVKYVNRFVPWGFHAWNTWQDAFWTFGRTTLWKPRPFTDMIGRAK